MKLVDFLKYESLVICDTCGYAIIDPIESAITGQHWCGGCLFLDHPFETLIAEEYYGGYLLELMLKSCTT